MAARIFIPIQYKRIHHGGTEITEKSTKKRELMLTLTG
jgi:hypothetical protein